MNFRKLSLCQASQSDRRRLGWSDVSLGKRASWVFVEILA